MENLDSLKIASNLLRSHREKLNLSIKEISLELRLEETIISLWRAEDMEENNGKFRYPFDEHGNLLPNTNITRRIDK